jgi:hypothetical protein
VPIAECRVGRSDHKAHAVHARTWNLHIAVLNER